MTHIHTHFRFQTGLREARLVAYEVSRPRDSQAETPKNKQAQEVMDQSNIAKLQRKLLQLKVEVQSDTKEDRDKARKTIDELKQIGTSLADTERKQLENSLPKGSLSRFIEVLGRIEGGDEKAWNDLKGILASIQSPTTLGTLFDGEISADAVGTMIESKIVAPIMGSEAARPLIESLQRNGMSPEKIAGMIFGFFQKTIATFIATSPLFAGTQFEGVGKEMNRRMAVSAFLKAAKAPATDTSDDTLNRLGATQKVMEHWSTLYDIWSFNARYAKTKKMEIQDTGCPTIAGAIQSIDQPLPPRLDEIKSAPAAMPPSAAENMRGGVDLGSELKRGITETKDKKLSITIAGKPMKFWKEEKVYHFSLDENNREFTVKNTDGTAEVPELWLKSEKGKTDVYLARSGSEAGVDLSTILKQAERDQNSKTKTLVFQDDLNAKLMP